MPIAYPFDGQYDGIVNRLGMGQKEAGFNPGDIDGLQLWLDAADSGTIIESGGFVSEWQDKSPEEDNVVQATGVNQPLTGTEQIGGLNTITFDGVNDFFFGAEGSRDIVSGDHTIFFVARLGIPDETQCLFAWNGSAGFFNIELFCFSTNGILSSVGRIGAFQIIPVNLSSQTMLVSISIDENDTMITRLDGAEQTCVDGLGNTAGDDNFLIGAELDPGDSPGNFIDMTVGEIIMVDRGITDFPIAEIQQVEQFLADKWGITLIVPQIFSVDFSDDFG